MRLWRRRERPVFGGWRQIVVRFEQPEGSILSEEFSVLFDPFDPDEHNANLLIIDLREYVPTLVDKVVLRAGVERKR